MADIVIVDADIGNIRSVENAFGRVGLKTKVSRDPEIVAAADAVVLPGVGAFKKAIHNLECFGLIPVLKSHVQTRKPLLGICLGMQLLADESEEFGLHPGLGFISGRVVKLSPKDRNILVPNIGWHKVNLNYSNGNLLFPSDSRDHYFYHVHSYHMQCNDTANVTATISYGGQEIVVAVQRDNVFGVQFHPEKSQNSGLDLIERFGKLV